MKVDDFFFFNSNWVGVFAKSWTPLSKILDPPLYVFSAFINTTVELNGRVLCGLKSPIALCNPHILLFLLVVQLIYLLGMNAQLQLCCIYSWLYKWLRRKSILGLIFDSTMTWFQVWCKISYYLCLLIDYSLIKMLLESLVLSHLSYYVVVWDPSLASSLLQRLQRMQNCTMRLCCGLQKYDHVSQIMMVTIA